MLDTQVVFIRNGEVQRILVYELGNNIQTVLGLTERHHKPHCLF
jgi:hypothetical protein